MGHSTRVALFALSLLVSAIVSLAVGMLGRAALLRVWLGWWPGWRGFEDGVFLAVIGLFFASPFLLIIATRVRERPGVRGADALTGLLDVPRTRNRGGSL